MVVFAESPINQKKNYNPRIEMFWVHCNGCYCQPESGVVLRFFITNCSHIYCEKCLTECTKECCKVCKSQCTTLELGAKLQKEVECLFEEPSTMIQNCFKKLTQTIEFQKSHQRRWCRHLKESLKAQNNHLKDVKKLVTQYRTMEKEIVDLKKENSYLKCLLAKNDPGLRAASRNGGGIPGFSPTHAVFSKGPQQASPRSGGSAPGMSSTQSIFCKSPQQSSIFNHQMPNKGQTSSVMNQPQRILMRTPPSEGKLGTTRSRLSYMTPGSTDVRSNKSCTPLSIPRPIYLSNTD